MSLPNNNKNNGEDSMSKGQVKWFNNKSGYGFITLLDDNTELKGKDIFSHHSYIHQKKY